MRIAYFVAAIWCFLLGVNPFHEEWVMQLTRWGVCGLCVYGAVTTKSNWRLLLAVLAVFYNPFDPINFGAKNWQSVHVLSGVLLFVFSFRKKK